MTKNLKGGDDVKLLVDQDKDGKETLSEETYTVTDLLDKHTTKIMNQTGISFNVHKGRIRRGEEKMEEKQEVATATATTTTKAKKTKAKPKVEPFDVLGWRKNCGGECLLKQCTFDHSNYKLNALVCVNEETGYYHTINTYEYPDGTISAGKNIIGSKYPLKGKKISKKAKDSAEAIIQKGDETSEEVKARYLKKGYKVI
jgi:hypothetical protein